MLQIYYRLEQDQLYFIIFIIAGPLVHVIIVMQLRLPLQLQFLQQIYDAHFEYAILLGQKRAAKINDDGIKISEFHGTFMLVVCKELPKYVLGSRI